MIAAKAAGGPADPTAQQAARLNFRRESSDDGNRELKRGGLQGSASVFLRHPPLNPSPGKSSFLSVLLDHVILSHQGEPEWGATVYAATAEASSFP